MRKPSPSVPIVLGTMRVQSCLPYEQTIANKHFVLRINFQFNFVITLFWKKTRQKFANSFFDLIALKISSFKGVLQANILLTASNQAVTMLKQLFMEY